MIEGEDQQRSARRTWGVTWVALFLVLALTGIGLAKEPRQARVTQFSPQGTVKKVRQVTARFAAPMVPLGDPRAAVDPFEVDCAEKGASRWIDSRTWAYDFARDLPAGVRCTFRMRSGVVTLAKQPIGGQQSFAFSTGGPAIVSSNPNARTDSIEEEQAFVLVLDAQADDASIEAHARFAVEGLAQPVGVRLLSGEPRAAILKTLWRGFLSGPTVVLQARQRFPNGAKVGLIWGKGVASLNGVAGEEDQVIEFKTRKAFTAEFRCERENAKANCIPLTPMRLRFSAPVMWEAARQIALIGPEEKRWSPQPPEASELSLDEVEFKGPFPEAATFRIELPSDLRDDAGRTLINAAEYPLTVKTDPFPPLAKFAARFGIIESQAEPVLPVTLRNLEPAVPARLQHVTGKAARVSPEHPEEILPWLRKVGDASRRRSIFVAKGATGGVKEFTLPKPNGAQAFEVVGIPLESPGLYIVELESPRLGASLLGKEQPMYVPTAALVTNLSVHFKWGREGSLVWVTTLDQARPVVDASVAVQDCRGTVLWSGRTDEHGIARIEGLPSRDALAKCHEPSRPMNAGDGYDDFSDAGAVSSYSLGEGLLVTAQSGEDLSFVHSDWSRGIEPWRFELPQESWVGPLVAHTIFDRPLFRAGETVHMKHLLRTQSLSGFAVVPEAERPTTVSIRHEGSNDRYEFPVQWDAAGIAESSWEIPTEAKLGRYQVMLSRDSKNPWRDQRLSGSFRVEEFRVPLMRGIVRLPAEPQVAAPEIPVDITVQHLAGGAAAKLPVRLRAQIRAKEFRGADRFERFTFATAPLHEGIVRRSESAGEDIEDGESPPNKSATPAVHQRQDLVLDAAGAVRTTINNLPPAATVRELLVEAEFRDPNGEVQTVASTVPLWPAKWLAGIKTEDWASSRNRIAAKVAVVDIEGRPVVGATARVDVRQRKTYSHRKRLVGGFYAYEHVEEITPRLATLCSGQTESSGMLRCEGAPPADGDLILEASVTDDTGKTTSATGDVWVVGETDWRFRVADSDRIDLLPERARYEPGETARLQVRMPFRDATALVTTEREGVQEAWVVQLSGTDPVVEVPVKDSYAPNMFISVLAVRGRIGDVQPTAMVDLGKPAFKLGVAEIRVGWRAHQLQVAVTADRTVYKVRETAAVKIAVHTPGGTPPPPGSEVALAAVDEGLLELQPNKSWDILDALMGRRGYGMRTATAQMQVVGKRHYGRKALPQGGGGGRQATRELFDTLLLWKGRVALDAAGEAAVEVPLNDSLTSFRIVAVATAGVAQFGTGATSIRSTQDLMILPGIPPLVREGDRFRPEFTVRNATDGAMQVAVNARVDGLATPLESQTVDLAPGEAKVLGWDAVAPVGVDALRYEVEARAPDGTADRVRVTQAVRPAVAVRTYQATLLRWEKEVRQPVQRPADALPDRGGVTVAFAPTLTDGLTTVRGWMLDYPYTCLEQRVSRAVALSDAALWQSVAASLPSYLDGDGLLKYFPTIQLGSDVLTSYVLAIAHAARLQIPADVQAKMEGGLRKFIGGSILRGSDLRTADLPIRKLAALEALARNGKAEPVLLGSIAIEPNLWPTSTVLDWWSLLDRMRKVPDQQRRRQEAEQIVRARLNLHGTTMGFSTERTDDLWWLMVSPDANAMRLMLHLLETNAWRDELPRLMRGALARQRQGIWTSTVANAWGTVAVQRFSEVFEKTPVTGTSVASLTGATQQLEWAQSPKGATLDFVWPASAEPLIVRHAGTGNPWVTIQANAAIPLQAPLSSGYQIKKSITPIEPRAADHFSRGDLLRVRLEVDAQADMTWVVVNDPIPAGASQVGTGLARESTIATQAEQHDGQTWPAFVERAQEAYRAYYSFVPKGAFVTEYTIRLNHGGRFQLPPTRVEALYAPEMFGELPNASMEVQP